jgi:hypothetical protein
MRTYELTDEELKNILNIARYAPSVHNTQPWQVQNQGDKVEISIDPRHKLGPGDPTGRQTIISLGIFTEAICLIAGTLGLSTSVKFNRDKVHIFFQEGVRLDQNIEKLLQNRATDRSIYKKTPIDPDIETSLGKCARNKSIRIWVIKDEDYIKTIAKLTGKGISLALSNPEFRDELRQYLIPPGSHKKRGISVKSLYIPPVIAALQPQLLKFGLSTNKEAALEEKRWLSASAIVLITSEGDLHDNWFESGQTYLRMSLEIERLGLSQATSAATVEAATFHEDIEKLIKTNQRLQVAVRIGKGVSKRQYSPRLSVEELITSN